MMLLTNKSTTQQTTKKLVAECYFAKSLDPDGPNGPFEGFGKKYPSGKCDKPLSRFL